MPACLGEMASPANNLPARAPESGCPFQLQTTSVLLVFSFQSLVFASHYPFTFVYFPVLLRIDLFLPQYKDSAILLARRVGCEELVYRQ